MAEEAEELWQLPSIDRSNFPDPSLVTNIPFGVLSLCHRLVSLKFSSLCKLVSIESRNFNDAWKLREIELPSSLERLEPDSFDCCTSLVQLDLSNLCNLQDIKCDLFKNAWSLREIAFPPNIQRIDTRSFTHSTSLTSLDFSDCEQLREIGFDTFVRSWSLLEIIFPPSLKKISAGAFLDCTSLMQLDLSDCVQFEEFGNNVFTDAFSLQEVIFPPNLPKITNHSFRNCTSLVRLRIPASVNEIETDAFSGCTNLEEVGFENPAGISIHERAFQNCPRLARLPRRPKRNPGFRYGKYSDLRETLQFGQGSEGGTCGISLEEFKDDSDIVVLPCGHAYIEIEFHEWFLKKNICPTCKVVL